MPRHRPRNCPAAPRIRGPSSCRPLPEACWVRQEQSHSGAEGCDRGLGVIGGREASQALARLIDRGAFEGPVLKVALQEAVRLASPLPEPLVTNLLRADDPGVRAASARCVRRWPKCAPSLIDLLQDLHEDVRLAAACALGRIGNGAARPGLLRALRQQPSREVVEAIAGIADQEVLVLLGRTAEIAAGSCRTYPRGLGRRRSSSGSENRSANWAVTRAYPPTLPAVDRGSGPVA